MIGKSKWNVTHPDMVKRREKDEMTLLSGKRKSKKTNFKKCERAEMEYARG